VDRVEPTLTDPVILWGYPAWQAALARVRGDRADRFEVYLGGIELANAFAEELDPDEIRRRHRESSARRRAAGRRAHPLDPAFVEAVGRMPRAAGIALGLDRLVMALTGAPDVRSVQAPG
jgi:lysyl-tRNA synthetase class 2